MSGRLQQSTCLKILRTTDVILLPVGTSVLAFVWRLLKPHLHPTSSHRVREICGKRSRTFVWITKINDSAAPYVRCILSNNFCSLYVWFALPQDSPVTVSPESGTRIKMHYELTRGCTGLEYWYKRKLGNKLNLCEHHFNTTFYRKTQYARSAL